MSYRERTFVPLIVAELVMLVLFCIFGKYKDKYEDESKYPLFQDIHVMIFIGFGYLMTFLKKYGYSSLGFTLLLGSFLIQWAILCQGLYNLNGEDGYKIEIGLESLYTADVAVAAFLISMGAVLGKTSVTQLFIMAFIEIIVYCGNLKLGTETLKVADAGGSIFVHIFGAYFGLAVSYVISRKKEGKQPDATAASLQNSTYTSDVFAMIGTIFLWLYWPSFNAIGVSGAQQQRAIVNTYLALASSCVAAFAVSILFTSERKLDMVHVQNSTLAGGVAIGATANLIVQPWGALAVGILAGVLSVFGYVKLSGILEERLKIPDTCGVHNLHGMPGVLAAVVGAICAAIATEDTYHESLYEIYPARINSSDQEVLHISDGRSAGVQGWYQVVGLAVTLALAVVSGLVTGLLLSSKPLAYTEIKFTDAIYWKLPEEDIENAHASAKGPSAFRISSNHFDNCGFEGSSTDGAVNPDHKNQ